MIYFMIYALTVFETDQTCFHKKAQVFILLLVWQSNSRSARGLLRVFLFVRARPHEVALDDPL